MGGSVTLCCTISPWGDQLVPWQIMLPQLWMHTNNHISIRGTSQRMERNIGEVLGCTDLGMVYG